ncbi:MAG: hypothetical protein GXY28_09270 [Bacteriovoracaceae bacterium]|nr:hypothetical protein [Bacteriovoracaceae bacterium]
MNVLAINGSPRSDAMSKTKMMLTALVEGMREAGASVEVVDLRDKKVQTCKGCMCCWTTSPGVCVIKDDMTKELFPRWIETDFAVYAFPLYHFTINAAMKAFIERTLPVLEPFFITAGKETLHPLRYRHPRVVFLSVAGFPEYSVFDQLSSWARFIYGRFGALTAEIYRPMSEALALPSLKPKADEILDATRRAGREIVERGKVSEQTMSQVTQDIVDDPKLFLQVADIMWKTCIREGISVREFYEKGCIPRPETIKEFSKLMRAGFNPEAAGGMKAVMQFDFRGSREGSCHLTIDGGAISASEGPAEAPDITISSDFDLWMDILCKKADGQQMFLEQKYAAQGDLGLLMRMNSLFGV